MIQSKSQFTLDTFVVLNGAGGFLFHSQDDVSVKPRPQQIPRAKSPPSPTTCAPDSPPSLLRSQTGEKIGHRRPPSMQKLYNVHFFHAYPSLSFARWSTLQTDFLGIQMLNSACSIFERLCRFLSIRMCILCILLHNIWPCTRSGKLHAISNWRPLVGGYLNRTTPSLNCAISKGIVHQKLTTREDVVNIICSHWHP